MFGRMKIRFGSGINRIKGLILFPIIIIVVVAMLIWALSTAIDHVEDTNGDEDISIVTITDMDIVNMNYGSRGLVRAESVSGAKIHSKKFTGVHEIFYNNYIGKNNTVTFSFTEFEVKEGNFSLVVVNEGQIIATLEPSDSLSYTFENITGSFSVRAVGESASFTIRMTNHEYNQFFHP